MSRPRNPPNDQRLIILALLAAAIGMLAGWAAWGLYGLIALVSNAVFHHRVSAVLTGIRDHQLGAWVLVAPVAGGARRPLVCQATTPCTTRPRSWRRTAWGTCPWWRARTHGGSWGVSGTPAPSPRGRGGRGGSGTVNRGGCARLPSAAPLGRTNPPPEAHTWAARSPTTLDTASGPRRPRLS